VVFECVVNLSEGRDHVVLAELAAAASPLLLDVHRDPHHHRSVFTLAGEADPLATAVRELREETGYEGENARLLGKIHSNPAILSNVTYTVLIENCRLQHGVEFDSGEDLITRLVPVAEIPQLVADEKIGHSLVVVALYYFDLWQRRIKR